MHQRTLPQIHFCQMSPQLVPSRYYCSAAQLHKAPELGVLTEKLMNCGLLSHFWQTGSFHIDFKSWRIWLREHIFNSELSCLWGLKKNPTQKTTLLVLKGQSVGCSYKTFKGDPILRNTSIQSTLSDGTCSLNCSSIVLLWVCLGFLMASLEISFLAYNFIRTVFYQTWLVKWS